MIIPSGSLQQCFVNTHQASLYFCLFLLINVMFSWTMNSSCSHIFLDELHLKEYKKIFGLWRKLISKKTSHKLSVSLKSFFDFFKKLANKMIPKTIIVLDCLFYYLKTKQFFRKINQYFFYDKPQSKSHFTLRPLLLRVLKIFSVTSR